MKPTIIQLEEDEHGEVFLPLTDEIFADLNWQVGDVVEWIDNQNGSWTLRKKNIDSQ